MSTDIPQRTQAVAETNVTTTPQSRQHIPGGRQKNAEGAGATPPVGDARNFLATITASCPDDQWGYVWTLDGQKRKRTHWFQLQDGIEPVLELAASRSEAADVYFGVATSGHARGDHNRVTSDTASGIYGLWADIDWDDSATHKKLNLPPTKEAALEILTMVGVPPTIVVDSGHGLHAWWVFGDFWLFDNDSDREAAQSLEQRWQDTIAVRAAQRGWVIDRTFDLARVLRLPGTMNHKDPTNTKPVTILSMGSTVSPSDFEDYLVAPEEISKLGLSAARTYVVGEFKLDPAAEPPRGKVDALRANHDTFGITVDRKRGDFSDQSPSSYDLALANIAASTGWSDQEIVDLLISVRRTHGDDLKLRQDYYSRTIRKAREVTAKEVVLGRPTDTHTDPRRTDTGNATRLVKAFGGTFRYVPKWGSWLHWDGVRWSRDWELAVVEYAKQVSAMIRNEAAAEADPDEAERLRKWALASESSARIEAMIKLARSVPGVPVDPIQLDSDPWLLNTKTGVIDLRTRSLMEHDPKYLMTKVAGVAYDPQAECPRFMGFLARVLPDEEDRAFLQRCMGYSLTGSTAEQVLLILYGDGANGKTTALNAIHRVVGDYGGTAEEGLLLRRGDVHPTGVADLQGQRFVVSSEIDDGRQLDEAKVKQLTGGDRLKARRLYQDGFEFVASHKLWIALNHLPHVAGTDEGIWRRLVVIPFTVSIPAAERDRQLSDDLAGEGSGILNWLLDGTAGWLHGGLRPSPSAIEVTAEYRREMNPVRDFIDQRCHEAPQLQDGAEELHSAFQKWAMEVGRPGMSRQAFGRALRQLGFTRKKVGGDRLTVWFGLAQVPPAHPA